jgi:hypothetical protein
MTLDLADTVKALGVEPFGYAYGYPDGIRFDTGGKEINGSLPTSALALYTAEQLEPAIRELIAQATAEALAQAAAAARKFVHRAYRSESNSSIVEQGIESCILSLRPDIAAKAKEHDATIRREALEAAGIDWQSPPQDTERQG